MWPGVDKVFPTLPEPLGGGCPVLLVVVAVFAVAGVVVVVVVVVVVCCGCISGEKKPFPNK